MRPRTPASASQVNAIGAVLATFVRGCGPAASGLLWALSLRLGAPGVQQFLPFLVVSAVALLAYAAYFWVEPLADVAPKAVVQAGSVEGACGAGQSSSAKQLDVENRV